MPDTRSETSLMLHIFRMLVGKKKATWYLKNFSPKYFLFFLFSYVFILMEGTKDAEGTTTKKADSSSSSSSRMAARRRRAELNQQHAQAAGVNKHPCYDLHQASLKCLSDNDYAQAACTSSFTAYRECLSSQVQTPSPCQNSFVIFKCFFFSLGVRIKISFILCYFLRKS